MAEAMELDLTLKKIVDETIKNPIVPPELDKNNAINEKNGYSIEAYYGDDNLGIDVLKQKYLAPWEKHPHELWQRQAKALASVEKTKSLRTKMEKEFLSILEDFRFVPGGRIMHGAGREDITTTLNNCYVVAVRNDSIKSIYETIINEALTYK